MGLLDIVRKAFNKQTAGSDDRLRVLDSIALDLKWRAMRGEDGLWGQVAKIDAERVPYREQGPLNCYTIVREPRRPYWQRVAEVNRYLDERVATHDDILLTIRHLEENPYLRRRRASSEKTKADHRLELEESRLRMKAEEQLYLHELNAQSRSLRTRPSRTEKYLLRTGLAIAGVALICAGIPLPIYAAML